MAYLTVDQFKAWTSMPASDVDNIEQASPGFTQAMLDQNSGRVEARLRKRYDVPLKQPIPHIVASWIVRLTTRDLYMRRGWNPSSAQDALVKDLADQAEQEMKEAADSNTGLFDIGIGDEEEPSAITQGGALGYAEQSPYSWTQLAREAAYDEDRNGGRGS